VELDIAGRIGNQQRVDNVMDLQQKVAEALAGSDSPAIFWSGGRDSQLLLGLAREICPITVLWFRIGQDERFAKNVIRDWGLMAFSWKPAVVYMVDQTVVHEYGIGQDRLPVLIDLVKGEPCKVGSFTARTATIYLPFDTILVGWRESDEHPLKGNAKLNLDGRTIGGAKLSAPLKHMTDSQVRAALVDYKIPYEPVADELPACQDCLDGRPCTDIPVVPLDVFRQRFGLEVN
jgi:3'-phosphoadenosine 5'-phosphosulfate sulfotransferase (PAPS reductase)/FAD synthetase